MMHLARGPRVSTAAGAFLILASCAGFALAPKAIAAPAVTRLRPTTRAGASLRFEANRGQFEDGVRYLARGRGYGLFLTREGATLELQRSTPRPSKERAHASDPTAVERRVLKMRVAGGASVAPTGALELQGSNNYLTGNDSSAWHTDIKSYERVVYENVRPGVSLVFYGNGKRELEYDLVLAPHVVASEVELEFDGIDAIRVNADGSATLNFEGGGELEKPAPVVYQLDETGRRVPVAARYEARARARLGFTLGTYDPARTLFIDPVLVYSTYLGGSSFDQAFGVASDPSGNTYVVGYTSSTLFPTVAPLQGTLAGGVYDLFICKLDPSGSFLYSTFLGGNGADLGYAIAADSQGNAYVTGVTYSTNFPAVAAFQATPGGKQDAFVAKLSPNGATLLYSTLLGGSGDDYAQGIAVSPSGNAYVVGTTFSTNFPQAAALQGALNGTSDLFIAKLSPNGSSLVYSTYLGGSGIENGRAIAVDSTGNAFVSGSTASVNFPVIGGAQPTFGGGAYDAFVSKLNSAGSKLAYSTFLGGTFTDEAQGLALSANGVVTVVGNTNSPNFPLASAAQATLGSAGHSDAFISRISTLGNALLTSTYLGGSGDDSAAGVAVDPVSNTAYVVGSTDSTDLPLEKPLSGQATYHGSTDAFVAAGDTSGSPFSYSTYLGGTAEDHAVGVALQVSNATINIVGNTFSRDFPVVAAPIATLVGSQDGFVSKLPTATTVVPATRPWSLLFLAGLLLGVGILVAPLTRTRVA